LAKNTYPAAQDERRHRVQLVAVGGEDRHHRSNPAAVGGQPEVIDAGAEDLLRGHQLAAIPHDQGLPQQATDAAAALPPRHPTGML